MSVILELARRQRRTGRSTVLLEGVAQSEDAVYICHDETTADKLARQFHMPRSRFTSLREALNCSQGRNSPFIFDHRAMELDAEELLSVSRYWSRVAHSYEWYLTVEAPINDERLIQLREREYLTVTGKFAKLTK